MVVELVAAVPGRVVVARATVVVVVVADMARCRRSGSSLKREPSAMSRVLSIGESTHRHPDPGSAGNMMENSLPTGEVIGAAGST